MVQVENNLNNNINKYMDFPAITLICAEIILFIFQNWSGNISTDMIRFLLITIILFLAINIYLQNLAIIKKKNILLSLIGISLASIVFIFIDKNEIRPYPRIQVEAFIDRLQAETGYPNGKKDLHEQYIRRERDIYISFIPSRSKFERVQFDQLADFYNFLPGEKVVVSLCGMEKDVMTHKEDDPDYENIYSVEFAVPSNIIDNCQ